MYGTYRFYLDTLYMCVTKVSVDFRQEIFDFHLVFISLPSERSVTRPCTFSYPEYMKLISIAKKSPYCILFWEIITVFVHTRPREEKRNNN